MGGAPSCGPGGPPPEPLPTAACPWPLLAPRPVKGGGRGRRRILWSLSKGGLMVTAWAEAPGSAPGRDPLSRGILGHSCATCPWQGHRVGRRAPEERTRPGPHGASLALWVTFLQGRQENQEAEPRRRQGVAPNQEIPTAVPGFRPLPARPAFPVLGPEPPWGC